MEIPHKDYKAKVLNENFTISEHFFSGDYVKQQSENDPSFFRWLFGEQAAEWNDFHIAPEAKESWKDFMTTYFE